MKYSIPLEAVYPKPVALTLELITFLESVFPPFPESVTLTPSGFEETVSLNGLKLGSPEAYSSFDRLIPKLIHALFPSSPAPSAILERLMDFKVAVVNDCVTELAQATIDGFSDLFGDAADELAEAKAQKLFDLWAELQTSVTTLSRSHHLLQEHVEHFLALYMPTLQTGTPAQMLQGLSDNQRSTHATLQHLMAYRDAYFKTNSPESLTAYYEESARLRSSGEVREMNMQDSLAGDAATRARFPELDEKLAVQSLAPEILA